MIPTARGPINGPVELRRLGVLTLAITLPLAGAIAVGGPEGALPHVYFHLLYIPLMAVAVVVGVVWFRRTPSRAIRVSLALVIVGQVLMAAGQAGELAVVFAHGGTEAGPLLEESDHLVWALSLTMPGFALGLAASIALAVTVAVQSRRGPLAVPVVAWITAAAVLTELVLGGALAVIVIGYRPLTLAAAVACILIGSRFARRAVTEDASVPWASRPAEPNRR